MALLNVKNLNVDFDTSFGKIRVVDGVSFELAQGEVLGVVGESGSGKSVTSLGLMGLISDPGVVTADEMQFGEHNLLTLNKNERRKLLGQDFAMIFQDPLTSLNPCFTVGFQIDETIKLHLGGSKKERELKACELLSAVGIPDPKARLKAYPHQLSGGMCQRIMIAIAIACHPKVLIADEPTTALDVTIQAQILDLLKDLNKQQGMGLMIITHDLAVVADIADRVIVMYCGEVVESGTTQEVLFSPKHPYTQALLQSVPEPDMAAKSKRLNTLSGVVPSPTAIPAGCRLSPRCPYVDNQCRLQPPAMSQEDHSVRCFFPLMKAKEVAHV